MRKPRPGKRPAVEVRKHQPQVTGIAERRDDRLDRVPVVAVLDVRCARCELASEKSADFRAEGTVAIVEDEVTHRVSFLTPGNAFELPLQERQVGVAHGRQQVARTTNVVEFDAGLHERFVFAFGFRQRAAKRIENP